MLCSITTYGLCVQSLHLLVDCALNINSLKDLSLHAPIQLLEQPCAVAITVPIL